MVKPVRLSDEAEAEKIEQLLWYADQAPAQVDRFQAAVEEGLLLISRYPGIGAPYGDSGHRKVLLRKPFHRFLLVYLELPAECVVIAVWEGHRNEQSLAQRL